jgi:hypothetical protein
MADGVANHEGGLPKYQDYGRRKSLTMSYLEKSHIMRVKPKMVNAQAQINFMYQQDQPHSVPRSEPPRTHH